MVARRAEAKAAQSEADDRLLVEAAQKDPSRFGDLYEVNFARVYAFVASRVHDRDAAQDLTSDVFHKALANLSRFEWRGVPFAAWLLRIESNADTDRAHRTTREDPSADDPPHPGTESDKHPTDHRAQADPQREQTPGEQP